MLELTEKRTLHSKTHDLGNGQYRLTASMIPMHYEQNGALLDIDMTIQNGVVNSGLYKVELMTDKIGFHAIDRASNKKISVNLGNIGNQVITYSAPTIDGNKASWTSVKPGVDIEFIFNPHQVNIFRVLQNAQAEKVAEWEVEEEIGEKTIRMNDKVRGRDAAKNETKHTVVIAPPEENAHRKRYVIKDTLEAKVFKRNPRTRVKEELDPVYPVRIDPTVSITISDTADDGRAYQFLTGTVVGNSAFNTNLYQNTVVHNSYSDGAYTKRKEAFLRFPGITIPQSSTVTSASLKPYITASSLNLLAKVRAKKLNNPAAPTNVAGVFSPGTLATNEVNKTLNTAVGNFASINIQSIVQELVNAFDYSNEAMLFFVKANSVEAVYKYANFEDFSDPVATNPAQLVIDYTAGGGGGGTNRLSRMTTLGCG